jgi:type IV pilus assembly protein PilE
MRTHTLQGFSLIELLVAICILGILAGISYPSYISQIQKARRSDAHTALLLLAARMEYYFTEHNEYTGADLNKLGLRETSAQNFYRLEIVSPSPSSFKLTAIPIGPQASDPCGSLSLDHINQKNASQSNCW